MVLRNRALLGRARTVILDEFHERSLETDLLLALLLRDLRVALVIMSATLEGERVASTSAVRSCAPRAGVSRQHSLPAGPRGPARRATCRLGLRAVAASAQDPGDVLVFLPGKGEIEACADALRGAFTLIPLHGGLQLDEQRRAFEPGRHGTRKIILATNVAETSLTIPGVGVVIDAGLVRQTRYQDGRGFLALNAIAEDSAVQRTVAPAAPRPACVIGCGTARRGSTRSRCRRSIASRWYRSCSPLRRGASAWKSCRCSTRPSLTRSKRRAQTWQRGARCRAKLRSRIVGRVCSSCRSIRRTRGC